MSLFPAVPARRSLETWAVWIISAALVLALVVVAPNFAFTAEATKTYLLALGAAVGLIFYIVSRLTRGSLVLPPMLLVGVLWLPPLAYLLSAAFAGNTFVGSLWGAGYEIDTLGTMTVAALLGTLVALTVRRSESYVRTLAFGAYVYGALAVLQLGVFIFGPGMSGGVTSFVGSYEDTATVLGLGVVGTLLALRFTPVATRARQLLTAVTIVALGLIAVSGSTFVWTAIALVALGLFTEAVLMNRSAARDESDVGDALVLEESAVESAQGKSSMIAPLLVLAVAVFFLFDSTVGNSLAESLKLNLLSVTPSWQSTLQVGQETYKRHAFFGSGPGTFGSQWLQHRDPTLNQTVFWNVDFSAGVGTIPTSIVTTGIAGLVAWVLMLLALLGLGLRVLLARTPRDESVRALSIIAFVSMAYLFAALIFRNPNGVVLALAFMSAGLFASTVRFSERAEQRAVIFAKSPRMGFVIVFTLTLVLFGAIATTYSLVDHYLALVSISNARDAAAANKLDDADAALTRSIAVAPLAVAYDARAQIALARLGEISASTTMPAADAQKLFQSTLSDGINAALTATQIEPAAYSHWIVLGNLYAAAVPLQVSGAYDSALAAYIKAKELHPTGPSLAFTIAQLKISAKKYAEAEEDLKTVISLKNDYTPAIFLLSQVQVQTGKVREALEAANATVYFAPKDPNALFQLGVLRAATNDLAGAVVALKAAVEANPEFANARYFLSAVYAKQGNLTESQAELERVGALSESNATAVAPLIETLTKGKNPFPANLLTVSSTPEAVPVAP